MIVKVVTPVRYLNLVEPLAHKATAMRTTETGGSTPTRSGAVALLIGESLRPVDVDSSMPRSTRPTTPGRRTSRTATATSTTRTTSSALSPSADSPPPGDPFTFEDLAQAWIDCRRTKRNSASALDFEANCERNLVALHEQLQSCSWRPGRSFCFVITHPRPREVWAAPFRDRIVHHLLYNRIGAKFEAGFVAGSCACIPGRGTLYGAQLLEHGVRSITGNWSTPAWYLKLDLANFFVSIDKAVLWPLLERKLQDPWWAWLAHTVLFHDPRQDFEVRCRPSLLQLVPPHKRLVNAPADTGLPIGNLSSQFFANVLLNQADQLVKHRLRIRQYVRYVDDMVLLATRPGELTSAHAMLAAWLPARLHLQLNPRKTILQPVDRGIDFVGQVIKPWRRTTRPRTLATALDRLQHMDGADVFTAGNSYLGLVRQTGHSHHEQAVLANVMRRRGHSVAGDLSKIFRRSRDA